MTPRRSDPPAADTRIPELPETDGEREEKSALEKGAALILTTILLTVMMGMAGFAIDLGWLYLKQVETQKAAEAAALAGVVHMPLPSGVAFSGSDAETAAINVANRNGYVADLTTTFIAPSPVTGEPNQLHVDIQTETRTWFARVFGLNTVSIAGAATAEQIPPLKLGSDDPYLGEDPTIGGRDRDFFVAISGQDRTKTQGDAHAAEFLAGGGGNPEYRVPSYWYAFELPAGSNAIGQNVGIQIFDPNAHDEDPDSFTNDWVNDNGRRPGTNGRTIFRVYAPDATPGDWRDNNNLLCEETFYTKGHTNYDPAAEDVWYTTCSINNAQQGYYVLEVSSRGRTDMINGWSLRGTINGSVATNSADLQVYGLGSMSLWQFETGSNPVFKIAKLEQYYAGSQLIISLWDISDIGSSGTLQFTGSANNIDCQVRQLDHRGNVDWDWTSDDGQANCFLTFGSGQYNNKWLEFRFDVPPDYTCSDCWVNVSYGVSGGITDRTTWSARINGQPIHLVF